VRDIQNLKGTVPLLVAVCSCFCCILPDAARYCWTEGSVSWGENYAGSSGLASPKLFSPFHFMEDSGSNAQAVRNNQ